MPATSTTAITPGAELVIEALKRSIARFYLNDASLIDADANERSMTHRLALYLQGEFPGWDVDCEYNRRGTDPKRLHALRESIYSDDLEGRTVFPDIIVHKRMANANLLVVEAKKNWSGSIDQGDKEKLEAFLADEEYHYRYGAWVVLSSMPLLYFWKRNLVDGTRPIGPERVYLDIELDTGAHS